MLSAPSRFGSFPDSSKFLIPASERYRRLLGHRISEYSRFHALPAVSADRSIGQALALPTTMTLYRWSECW